MVCSPIGILPHPPMQRDLPFEADCERCMLDQWQASCLCLRRFPKPRVVLFWARK